MLRRFAPFAADLIHHRDLLRQFTLRNVELRHKGSHLGLVWSVLNPLLMLGLYVLVFGYIFSGSFGIAGETRTGYGLTIFLGLTLYHFVAEALVTAPGVVVAQPNFVKKVVFPLEILPAANLGAAEIFAAAVVAEGEAVAQSRAKTVAVEGEHGAAVGAQGGGGLLRQRGFARAGQAEEPEGERARRRRRIRGHRRRRA